jgi:hypothetical protein
MIVNDATRVTYCGVTLGAVIYNCNVFIVPATGDLVPPRVTR